jgi:hypothetical protein
MIVFCPVKAAIVGTKGSGVALVAGEQAKSKLAAVASTRQVLIKAGGENDLIFTPTEYTLEFMRDKCCMRILRN